MAISVKRVTRSKLVLALASVVQQVLDSLFKSCNSTLFLFSRLVLQIVHQAFSRWCLLYDCRCVTDDRLGCFRAPAWGVSHSLRYGVSMSKVVQSCDAAYWSYCPSYRLLLDVSDSLSYGCLGYRFLLVRCVSELHSASAHQRSTTSTRPVVSVNPHLVVVLLVETTASGGSF